MIGILVQVAREASLLIGGIRSAAITSWGDKLMTLLVNSLLETNLGMPYVYVLYPLYSSRFTEQLKKAVKKSAFSRRRKRIRNNGTHFFVKLNNCEK